MNALAERRRRGSPGETCTHEPERKRVCRSLEPGPQEMAICHPSNKKVTDSWYMEQHFKQKVPTELFSTHNMKEMPKSMGHFGHMMDL